MSKVVEFLQANPVQYLATVGRDGKAKCRPFMFSGEMDGKLWFCTNNTKDVYKDMQSNPEIEISVSSPEYAWIRLHGKAVFESNSPESVRNLIAAGLGIGFWPEKAWGGKPGHGVVLIPIRYPNCRRDLVVTVFEQAGNKPVVDEFVNYFCKYFEKDPSGMGDVTV